MTDLVTLAKQTIKSRDYIAKQKMLKHYDKLFEYSKSRGTGCAK